MQVRLITSMRQKTEPVSSSFKSVPGTNYYVRCTAHTRSAQSAEFCHERSLFEFYLEEFSSLFFRASDKKGGYFSHIALSLSFL